MKQRLLNDHIREHDEKLVLAGSKTDDISPKDESKSEMKNVMIPKDDQQSSNKTSNKRKKAHR